VIVNDGVHGIDGDLARLGNAIGLEAGGLARDMRIHAGARTGHEFGWNLLAVRHAVVPVRSDDRLGALGDLRARGREVASPRCARVVVDRRGTRPQVFRLRKVLSNEFRSDDCAVLGADDAAVRLVRDDDLAEEV
jgi:hypothetical protein